MWKVLFFSLFVLFYYIFLIVFIFSRQFTVECDMGISVCIEMVSYCIRELESGHVITGGNIVKYLNKKLRLSNVISHSEHGYSLFSISL